MLLGLISGTGGGTKAFGGRAGVSASELFPPPHEISRSGHTIRTVAIK